MLDRANTQQNSYSLHNVSREMEMNESGVGWIAIHFESFSHRNMGSRELWTSKYEVRRIQTSSITVPCINVMIWREGDFCFHILYLVSHSSHLPIPLWSSYIYQFTHNKPFGAFDIQMPAVCTVHQTNRFSFPQRAIFLNSFLQFYSVRQLKWV